MPAVDDYEPRQQSRRALQMQYRRLMPVSACSIWRDSYSIFVLERHALLAINNVLIFGRS
jgi:hypothetical protein